MKKREESSQTIPGSTNPPYNPMQPNPLYVPYAVQYPQRHLKKLFVGQIPKTFTEEDVKQIFSDTCQVYTAHIIKDKVTMEHRGCAFIYVDPSVAELVKEKYHNNYCCPKMTNKLQVRDANPSQRYHSHDNYSHSFPYQMASVQTLPESGTQPESQSITQLPTDNKPSETEGTTSASPVVMQQVSGMYSVPYYSMMPQNMMMPQMMVPVTNASSQETSATPANPTVMNPMQSYMMPYIPVQTQKEEEGEQNTPVQTIQPVMAYPYGTDPSGIPMVLTPNGFWIPYSPYSVESNYGNYSNQHQQERNRRETSPEANLFVFNLPPDYDDNRLKELFSPFGAITSTKVIFEKETNISKGYGFVNFEREEDAKRAIKEMDGKIINKKKLTVQVKKPRS